MYLVELHWEKDRKIQRHPLSPFQHPPPHPPPRHPSSQVLTWGFCLTITRILCSQADPLKFMHAHHHFLVSVAEGADKLWVTCEISFQLTPDFSTFSFTQHERLVWVNSNFLDCVISVVWQLGGRALLSAWNNSIPTKMFSLLVFGAPMSRMLENWYVVPRLNLLSYCHV